jgi:polar amino acid transport system substrate-binding protein
MNGVDVRSPLLYTVVGGVLALISTVVFGSGAETAGRSPAVAAPAPPAAGPVSPGPPCVTVRDSLRPTRPLPVPGAMPAGSTMAAIAARGRLIVGVDQSKYLAGFRNPTTGDLDGSDIELTRRIAAALLGDPTKVQFVALSAADRVGVLTRSQVDLVVDTFTVTCGRQRDVEFSSDYMLAAQRLLVPSGVPAREVEDLAGQRVCTSRGSTTEAVLRALPLHLDVVTLPAVPDCVVRLQRGQVAAVSSDDVILAGLAAQDPTLRVVGRPLDRARYAIGVNRRSPDLVRFVNGVLEQARADGGLTASYRRWYAGALNPVPTPPPARYRD